MRPTASPWQRQLTLESMPGRLGTESALKQLAPLRPAPCAELETGAWRMSIPGIDVQAD